MGESNQKQDKEGRRFDPELLKKGLRCDLDQYEMLKRCSGKKDMAEWNEWREKNRKKDIFLEGADFEAVHLENADLNMSYMRGAYLGDAKLGRANLIGVYLESGKCHRINLRNAFLYGAHLEGANFDDGRMEGASLDSAYLKGAKLRGVHLEKAGLRKTHLEGADLLEAHIEGASFKYANLRHASFRRVTVDGATIVWKCYVDRHIKNAVDPSKWGTDFSSVGLGRIRVDPGTKQLLEYNIRRMNWQDWYKEGAWCKRFLKNVFIRTFWGMSDYGRSTLRVVGVFFLLALLFAGIYANWAYWAPPGIVSNLEVQPEIGEAGWHYFFRVVVRPVYFSIVTMTTLGFGDMYANKGSIAGHVILAVQVILGYVLLGALVTRFAVLFTAGGPAGQFAEEKKKTTK